ncbi:hypothetical protein J2S43_006791 [Catenuloplanes nepalensis]|uniref:DUF4034 domain-containing protein n=1 Tax=Catenuloplanes nepalensis TaxID=587533 RepID=A0ABT9N3K5_9ACTN|nr:DUF4034 domain-containing protein [Catenuloplanes nepalensis]MDP9798279.1 hypothetical protein [Catenuloplanes nepalensis]
MWPFGKRKKQGLTIDPAYGDPGTRTLLDALARKDWQTARDILTPIADPDELAYTMEAVGSVDGLQDWIGDWIAAEPRSTLPVLVRGCHAVHWAWDARGGARAEQTREEQFREFHRRLRIAEHLLADVAARDNDDVTARTWLVTSSRGIQIDRDIAQARFDAVVTRHPTHVIAHEQRLQYLCAKWFGSHDEMFEFAHTATAAAPAGSLLWELLPVAHLEKWLDVPAEDGADKAYITSAEVRADLTRAADGSVLHPSYRFRPAATPRVATFAMTLEMTGEFERASRTHEILGDRVSAWPWQYCGNPVDVFENSRLWVRNNLP